MQSGVFVAALVETARWGSCCLLTVVFIRAEDGVFNGSPPGVTLGVESVTLQQINYSLQWKSCFTVSLGQQGDIQLTS